MRKAFSVAVLVAVLALPATAHPSTNARGALSEVEGQQQRPAGDKDAQAVITGCVQPSGYRDTAGPRSLIVWSKGDVYFETATVQTKPSEHAVATAGDRHTMFYWIDDENDFAKHAGQQVEIVGEISGELKKGEFETEPKGAFTEIEFGVEGRETKVLLPSAWLSSQTPAREAEFDIVLRTVDVEKVNVLGPCR
jgi:hypothetical protein